MAMGKFISQNRMIPKTSLCLSLVMAAVQYDICSLLHVHLETELSAAESQPPCLNTIIEPRGSYRAAQTAQCEQGLNVRDQVLYPCRKKKRIEKV
jgi:hypothetical protein